MRVLSSRIRQTAFPLRLISSRKIATRNDRDGEQPSHLLDFKNVTLQYPTATSIQTEPIDFRIQNPSAGGHVLLGRNGVGKTLISRALSFSENSKYLVSGKIETSSKFYDSSVAHVSFQSHEELLKEGGTAYRAISGGSNKLNPAAQFLVVRFGLFPLLYRDVSTLSTGEIRKVLLVRALARRPRLLVLDNAFDGLDAPSRKSLSDLVSRTLRGFRPDILVQSVDARSTEHTQILLLTHRSEEIVDEIEHVSTLSADGSLFTERRERKSGDELLSAALCLPENSTTYSIVKDAFDNDSELPPPGDIRDWWYRHNIPGIDEVLAKKDPVIQATDLLVEKADYTVLNTLSWTVKCGERWLIGGGNGAGKSTLSRLLARNDTGIKAGNLKFDRTLGVGWSSTELHMQLAQSETTVTELLGNDHEDILVLLDWLGLDKRVYGSRLFSTLSQGEQKVVLIAAALKNRPNLLVLDEPCQGLDLENRARVLGVVERICRASDVSLIYITHHLEELLPSITHILHLKKGHVVFNGARASYDPEAAEGSTIPEEGEQSLR